MIFADLLKYSKTALTVGLRPVGGLSDNVEKHELLFPEGQRTL